MVKFGENVEKSCEMCKYSEKVDEWWQGKKLKKS